MHSLAPRIGAAAEVIQRALVSDRRDRLRIRGQGCRVVALIHMRVPVWWVLGAEVRSEAIAHVTHGAARPCTISGTSALPGVNTEDPARL